MPNYQVNPINTLKQPEIVSKSQSELRVTYYDLIGNDYSYGNCTAWVADNRPVPVGLGNARDWLANAKNLGMPISDTPRVGAVAWEQPGNSLGHVAWVIEVYKDGSFLISEANVVGFNQTDERIISDTSGWKFIYT